MIHNKIYSNQLVKLFIQSRDIRTVPNQV